MMPIQDLLNRIQWDANFGMADFVIGYYDRVTGTIKRVPYAQIRLQPGAHFSFEAIETDGSVHSVP
ncbi:MAG: DUF504 domain-containing protein, partial [Burkholderiales bacterium]|nr:DUF504 domain-containing protein [Burkholderiales bacterium]